MIFANCRWVLTSLQRSVNCTQIENKQLYTWGETIHKTMQKHRTHKLEGKTYTTGKQT